MKAMYGGGPEICRESKSIYSEVVVTDPGNSPPSNPRENQGRD